MREEEEEEEEDGAELVPAPDASVQLSAPIDAVDWVQVVPR